MVNRSEDVPRLPVNESTHTHTSDDPGLSAKDPPDVIREHDRPTGNSGTKAKLEGRPDIPPQVTVNDVYRRKADVFTQEKKEEAWSSAATMVETYSDAMVKRWKEEIDTYLVFAGLFSAVLTTFNVQTYPLLRPAAPDPSIAMLQQISSQLASFSISNSFVNSTRLASTGRPNIIDPPPAPRWAVWLNALWLSSLVLSLSSASIGIMAKQWLNEYQSGVSGTSRPVARVRLHRLNNLRAWHVEDIINTIPVLLQLALAMFLAGLLILLWNYNDTVAAVASALVCVLSAFTMATTVLPLFHHSCSYLAPHTRTLHSLWKSIAKKTKAATRYLRDIAQSPRNVQVTTLPGSKADGEQTWQGREQSAIEQKQVNWDTQTLVEAYKITLHPDSLSAATVCLMDIDAREVIDYFQQLHTSAREHLGVVADSKYGLCGDGRQQQLLWLLVILCVLQGDFSLTCDEAASLDVYFQSGHWPTSMQAADAEWAVSTLDALTDHLARAGNRTMKLINQEILCAERRYLIHKFAGREIPLASIIFIDVTREYREVRLREMFLSEASLDEAKTAHTGYLSSVDHFLECADRALAPSHSINGLEIVRTYVRDVVAELTRTLLRIFAEDGVQSTITAETLWDVIHRLANIVSDSMLQCIPDDLRSDVLRMANILAEPRDYGNFWGSDIPGFARKLVSRIIDIKGKPDHEHLTKRSPACATVETSNAAQISSKAAAACASSAASGGGEDSREQKASPLTEAPS